MHCLCKVDILRCFIKSVAQIELSTPRLPQVRHNPGFRAWSPKRKSISSSAYHLQAAFQSFHIDTTNYVPPSQERAQSVADLSRDLHPPGTEKQLLNDGEPAFLDLSPVAIDALAAESKADARLAESLLSSNIEDDASELESASERQINRDPATEALSHARSRRSKISEENISSNIARDSTRSPIRITRSIESSRVRRGFQWEGQETTAKLGKQEEWSSSTREPWMTQKAALKAKFPEGWNPRKRLSPDALEGIRALHAQMPERYTTRALAESFRVSPEAIRKILSSKWTPNPGEKEDRADRWFKRGQKVWSRYAELGVKPPAKWRDLGIGKGKPKRRKRLAMDDVTITTMRRAGGSRQVPDDAGVETEDDNLSDRIL